ncbi:MAG: PadR family transcriptional regulator [Actinobacteria bacterium]|nr:PadR family transcriptional regulator [Actinomycetota bacterium]
MLELAILGQLKERSMHGYQLSKQLSDTLGGFWRVSYGSLYPSLRRLEKQGAVEREFTDESVGRRKNVYRITPVGEELFQELLQEGSQDNEENKFRVRMAFFKYLGPDMRIKLLERRRAYLQERLTTLEATLAKRKDGGDAYTLSMMTHGQDSTQSDIAWIDDLIAAERRTLSATPAKRTRKSTRPSTTRAKTTRASHKSPAAARKEPTI